MKKNVVKAYREAIDDDNLFNETIVFQSVGSVVNRLQPLRYEATFSIPQSLKICGILEGEAAELYADEYILFIGNLKIRMDESIDNLIFSVNKIINPEAFPEVFCSEIKGKIDILKDQILMKRETLRSLHKLRDQLASLLQDYQETIV